MNGSEVMVALFAKRQQNLDMQSTLQDPLSGLHVTVLICCHKRGHCYDLRVVFVSFCETTLTTTAYGLVSCESNGLISLPMSMYASTRYLSTWIRWVEPDSSYWRKDSNRSVEALSHDSTCQRGFAV